MSERTFVTYGKKGDIIQIHKFVAAEDSTMFTDSEMLERSINLASKDTHIGRPQIHILELKEDLQEGHQYKVDVTAKKLKSKVYPARVKRKKI